MGIIPQLVRFTIQNYRAAGDNTEELAQSADKQSNQLQHLQMMMVAPDQVSLSRYLVLMTIPGCEAVWVRADYGVGGCSSLTGNRNRNLRTNHRTLFLFFKTKSDSLWNN